MTDPVPENPRRQFELRTGRVEIAVGGLAFLYATLSPMISRFYPMLEPDTLFGLWPLLIMFAGVALVAAGAGLVRNPVRPWLMHLPLIAWLIVCTALLW